MAMTTSDRELMDEKFHSLHIVIKGLGDKMETMIAKQNITNGRVNKLEDSHLLNGAQHQSISDILIEIKDTLSDYKKRNIGFWLYFSEKPYRLVTFAALLVAAVLGLGVI